MYYEKKSTAGNWHMLAQQQRDMSCGYACIGMVAYRHTGKQLSESELRAYSHLLDQGAYGQAKYAKGKAFSTKGFSEIDGGLAHNMAVMLRKFTIPCKVDMEFDILALMRSASPSNPVIGRVAWPGPDGAGGGGAHFVVIDGMEGDKVVICDPWYGMTEMVPGWTYRANGGAQGTFAGCVIPT